VGDYTWIDANRDGVQNDGAENVLPDVTVELLDPASGDVIDTTTSDENGFYLFDLLPAGDYQVRFVLTPDQAERYAFTTTDGEDPALDSDAHVTDDPTVGVSEVFTLGE